MRKVMTLEALKQAEIEKLSFDDIFFLRATRRICRA